MCLVPKNDTPDAPRPMLPREAPKRVDDGVKLARERAGTREQLARGYRSTFRAGPGGLQKPALTMPGKLLGE